LSVLLNDIFSKAVNSQINEINLWIKIYFKFSGVR
jgi:hypothetical protein